MTAGQMELPLSSHSSAADPTPERERTHPRQMILKHCAKQREHVSHAYEDGGSPFGCPGTPDIRDLATVAEQAREAVARVMNRHNEVSLEWERVHETARGVEDVELP